MPGNLVRINKPFIPFKAEDIEQSIPSRFEEMVEKYPDRMAVKDKNYELTYRELNQAANRLAWAIMQKTPKGNGPVGAFLKQGVSLVTAHSETPGEPRLVAYIVPSTNPPPAINEFRQRLSKTLPDYMIPSAFIMLETLPLTATGKVDRGALPKPGKERPELEVAFVAPNTSIEEELEQIWSEVLGLEQIGIHDPFLELGGDSLRATQLITRLRDRFQVEVPMQTLLEAPTISEMAEAILIHKTHQIGPEEMERLLDEVETSSEGD